MSIQKTLPKFKITMDLGETLKSYITGKNKSSFVEGGLTTGVFARTTIVTINARTKDEGIQRFTFDTRDSYTLAVKLEEKDLFEFENLCKRVEELGLEQCKDDDDPWEFKSPIKEDKTWYVKVRVKNHEFLPVINGGLVTMDKPCATEAGDKVKIVGTFGVWMNPKLGQFGIKFDAKTIDF